MYVVYQTAYWGNLGPFCEKATYAWNWPNTEPIDQARVVLITADRAALPSGRYSIFSRELVAYKQNDNEYGLGNFICLSSSDPATSKEEMYVFERAYLCAITHQMTHY